MSVILDFGWEKNICYMSNGDLDIGEIFKSQEGVYLFTSYLPLEGWTQEMLKEVYDKIESLNSISYISGYVDYYEEPYKDKGFL